MNLRIPLPTLWAKARQFPDGFYESCLASGRIEGGELVISVDDYDRIKGRKKAESPAVRSTEAKANGCCGGNKI